MQIDEIAVYTPSEIAEIFHVDRHRVCAWIKCGWLKAFTLAPNGRTYLVTGYEVWEMVRRYMRGQYPQDDGVKDER